MKLKDIEIFASGGPWNGRTFSDADLDAMVSSFHELGLSGRVPVKIGHVGDGRDDQPAMGWLESLRRVGDKLLADLSDVDAKLIQDVKAGKFRHISVELLQDVERDGVTYPWAVDGIAILGAARPAVSSLERLDRLIASALPGLACRARFAFTAGGDDAATLRAEVARLHREMIVAEFDGAIKQGRVLPRDRFAFERAHRMGAPPTLEDARLWIAGTPHAPPLNRPGVPAGYVAPSIGDSLLPGTPPDAQVVFMTRESIAKSGGRLSYYQAQREVLQSNPELAEKYRSQPGIKER
jgi:hypothetical protein